MGELVETCELARFNDTHWMFVSKLFLSWCLDHKMYGIIDKINCDKIKSCGQFLTLVKQVQVF